MNLITRVKMRRAYNYGNWEKARFYANKLLPHPGESDLAKSVIVRSYWNQGDLGKAGELLAVWKDSELDFMREKYERAINTTNETEKCLETSCLIFSTIQDSVNILQTPPGF